MISVSRQALDWASLYCRAAVAPEEVGRGTWDGVTRLHSNEAASLYSSRQLTSLSTAK